jgi:hypothetical protein
MKAKVDLKSPEQSTPVQASAPRKRFRIEKVEERIATKRKHPHHSLGSISGNSDPLSTGTMCY